MRSNIKALNIQLGAYGWQHAHWLNRFYPDDLPEDWQLMYYSNEFNCVLVPAAYWQRHTIDDCAEWIGNVHENFRFFVECHGDMFAYVSKQTLCAALQVLQPQLSALVFSDVKQPMSQQIKKDFVDMIDLLGVDVCCAGDWLDSLPDNRVNGIWRNTGSEASNFAVIENDLTDLRVVRVLVEQFVAALESRGETLEVATMIVDHPQLQADDLSKLRAVLNLMGY